MIMRRVYADRDVRLARLCQHIAPKASRMRRRRIGEADLQKQLSKN